MIPGVIAGGMRTAASASVLQYVGGMSGLAGSNSPYSISLNGTLTGGIASSPSAGDIIIVASAAIDAVEFPGMTCTGNNNGAYDGVHAQLWAPDSNDINFRTFYKIQGSTPDTSLSLNRPASTFYGSGAAIHVWRGVDQVNPFDVTTTTAKSGNSHLPNPPAITPVTSGAVILACGGASQATTSESFDPLSFPGMENLISFRNDGTSADGAALIASVFWNGLGPFDPPVASGGAGGASHAWAACTLALRPAA